MKYLICSLAVVFLLVGCSTTWQDAGGKSLATIAQSVDAGMKGWEAYSVASGLADNDPAELRVKSAYIQYQNAFNVALTAYNAAATTKDQSVWAQASTALSASEGNLLNLINALQPKASQ